MIVPEDSSTSRKLCCSATRLQLVGVITSAGLKRQQPETSSFSSLTEKQKETAMDRLRRSSVHLPLSRCIYNVRFTKGRPMCSPAGSEGISCDLSVPEASADTFRDKSQAPGQRRSVFSRQSHPNSSQNSPAFKPPCPSFFHFNKRHNVGREPLEAG